MKLSAEDEVQPRTHAAGAPAVAGGGVLEGTPSWLQEFEPPWYLRNGHLQTIVGNFLPRKYSLPEPEARWIEVEAGEEHRHGPTMVACMCHWQCEPAACPTMLLLHGLEGSSNSQYVLGNASRAWAGGWNVVRMNMRSCGGGEEQSPSLYHSGRSSDVGKVVMELVRHLSLPAIALVGYSMGGNMVLKLAGELGEAAPPELRAIVGVSPLMDLSASSDALHELQNRLYERRFLRAMLRRFERKSHLFPKVYPAPAYEPRSICTMRDFDEHIVARYAGFSSADDYYAQVSSSQFVSRIAVPTLILHAADDPFIRMLSETRRQLESNPCVTLIETKHGGHCAFLSKERGNDGYWAEKTLFGYLRATIDGGA
ncbi:MAG TPA: alpha/beta fold hydrolase [Acidisarcina sp.]